MGFNNRIKELGFTQEKQEGSYMLPSRSFLISIKETVILT